MPVPSVRDRQREAREEAILDGAQELMAVRGCAAVTMDDLAAALKVSKATLYQHFRSKEELAVSVLTRVIRRTLAAVQGLDPDMPPLRRIEAIVCSVVQRRYAEGHLDLGHQVPTLLPILMKSPEYQEVVREIKAMLTALVDQAKRAGDIDVHLSTAVLVEAFLGLVRNTDYQPLIDTGECTVDDVKRTVSTLVRRGMQAGGPRD